MQSPLAALLDSIKQECDKDSIAASQASDRGYAAGAAAAWAAAQRTGALLPDVLAILMQPSVQGCMPDADLVASCKQRGTDAFGRGQHRQAATLFTEALRYCDEGSQAGAHLAARLYSNRALCLTHLQPPQLAAAAWDSCAAIACDPSFAKAWYRRACAARTLGSAGGGGMAGVPPWSALQDARRSLQLLQDQGSQDTSQVAALVAELEEEQAQQAAGQQAEQTAAGQAQGTQLSVPFATDTVRGLPAPSEAHVSDHAGHSAAAQPSCTSGHTRSGEAAAGGGLQSLLAQAGPRLLEVETEDAGRCLAAAEHLPAGADALREQPFAHSLTRLGRRSVCATCLAPLAGVSAPFYCRRCPMAAYCSLACRNADPFHAPGGPECGWPWPVLLPPEAVAALRLARRLRAPGVAESAEGCQVAALGTHFADMAPEDAAELAALASVAHATWQLARAEAQAGERGGAQQAGCGMELSAGDVLEALCRLQINGLAVVPAARRGSEDRLALAVYPVGSLMNHACLPNVSTRFEGGTLVVRCIEALSPGQPLLHCYGPQVGEMTAAQRQAMLQRQYLFACSCRACRAGAAGADTQQALADAGPAGLRCPAGRAAACTGAALPAAEVAAGLLHRHALPAGTGACCTCGARLSKEQWQQEALPNLQAAAEAHAAALEQQERRRDVGSPPREQAAAAAAAAQRAVQALRQCLRLRQQHLHPHNLLLGATHDSLARAWQVAGNVQAAAQHLRHSLAVLLHAYPPNSTAAAFQRRDLARLLRLAAAEAAAGSGAAAVEQLLEEARAAEEAADGVLELHFGHGVEA